MRDERFKDDEEGRKKLMTEQPEEASAGGSVQFLNPDDLPKNPAYTNVIVVSGAVKTIYIGAQGAFDASTGTIVSRGDIGAQSMQVMKNIQAALAAAGAGLEHIIKWNIYLTQGQPLQPGVEAFQRVWGNRPNPPINTVMYVSELVPSDFLVCIDAIAVVPL
jgi:enamine deaminase RidA (YjgF/YER057c/UK114 family)